MLIAFKAILQSLAALTHYVEAAQQANMEISETTNNAAP
jgi:hypothetical protein